MSRRSNIGRIILSVASVGSMLAGGCIREKLPECPPLAIELTVRDKNYFNIDDAVKLGLMERQAEDRPFRTYVRTLYCIIHDEQGNVVTEQHNRPVENDEVCQTIVLPASLPYGRYTVTVWGNLTSEAPLSEEASQAELEAAGAAANDVYLASGTFDYRYGQEHFTLGLERTKGNLLIRAEGMPDNIDFSTKHIENVFARVDNHLDYSQLTDIRTKLEWEVRNEIQTQTRIGPSPSYEGSKLTVTFLDKSAETGTSRTAPASIEPQEVYITINRNEITILKYLYQEDESGGTVRIYVLVNNNWELLHQMVIE